jgi:hypothetical protein
MMRKRRTINQRAQDEWTRCRCSDCLLPDEGPPRDLYQKAVPIWHDTSINELEDDDEFDRIGYVKAFAGGIEVGLIMANLRPEWARAFYLELRRFYLTTHTTEDLEDWEDHARELCDAIPMFMASD